MKKFLLIMIFFICSLVCVNANYVNLNNDFDKNVQEIIVNVPSNVYLYQGDEFGINIRTIDEDLYKHIKYEIKDNKLYIDFKDYILRENDLIEPEDIRINIQAPNNIKNIRTNSYLLVAKTNKNTIATNNEKN
jgi:hypothetical protein